MKLEFKILVKQSNGSLLAQERGLKLHELSKERMPTIVAPRAGAWIETYAQDNQDNADFRSLLAQERGLKLSTCLVGIMATESLLAQERGLKQYIAEAEVKS